MDTSELGRIIGESYIKGIVFALIHFGPYLIAIIALAILGKLVENAIVKAIDQKRRERRSAKSRYRNRKPNQNRRDIDL